MCIRGSKLSCYHIVVCCICLEEASLLGRNRGPGLDENLSQRQARLGGKVELNSEVPSRFGGGDASGRGAQPGGAAGRGGQRAGHSVAAHRVTGRGTCPKMRRHVAHPDREGEGGGICWEAGSARGSGNDGHALHLHLLSKVNPQPRLGLLGQQYSVSAARRQGLPIWGSCRPCVNSY